MAIIKALCGIFLFTLCIDVSILQAVETITPVVLLSSNDSLSRCPSIEARQETLQLLQATVRGVIQTSYGILISECGQGRWRRAFYVNASQLDQSCPGDWSVQTSPVRGCAGASSQCSSAFSGDINTANENVILL